MITKSFNAPIGAGLRKLAIAPQILTTNKRKITVIAAHKEMADQWAHILPMVDVEFIGPMSWMRRASDGDDDLIIVDNIHPDHLNHIRATLESVKAQAWLVNCEPHEGVRPTTSLALHHQICGRIKRHNPGDAQFIEYQPDENGPRNWGIDQPSK